MIVIAKSLLGAFVERCFVLEMKHNRTGRLVGRELDSRSHSSVAAVGQLSAINGGDLDGIPDGEIILLARSSGDLHG